MARDIRKQELIRNINDIISGDIITLRNDLRGIVIDTLKGMLIQFYDNTFDCLNVYKNNLTHINYSDLDMIKVCRIEKEYQVIPCNFKDAPVIWERKENHTIEETEEETVIRIPKGVDFEFKIK